MLVLANANGFWVNFHQLGQWVLQAARNAGRTAQAHVHVRHFLAGKFAGGINRGTGLADHHALHAVNSFHQVRCKLVCFAAGGTVANGNQVHAVLFAQLAQRV